MFYCDKKFIGKRLKQARIKAKLSQGQLAEQIEISEKHISNIERGLNFPALDTFFKLCVVLNLKLDDFGVEIYKNSSKEKENLLYKIHTASENELIAYNNLINTFNKTIDEYLNK